jgi:two-component system, NarL family, sensor histidine kinase DesK
VAPDGNPGGRRAPQVDGSRVMRVLGPSLGVVWLVFLLQPWQAAWDAPRTPERVVSLVAIAGLAAGFAWVVLTRAGPHRDAAPHPRAGLVILGLVLLVALSTLAAREQGLVGLVFVCVCTVFLLRDPRALAAPIAVAVVVVVLPRLVPGWRPLDDLVVSVVLATAAVYGFSQLVQRNRQLAAARDEVAVLAVERERERIARDVHDVLGHSLTLIALKAELAGRMVDVDPGRARAEIAEVQALARSALADVRGTVAATRAVTLAGELAGARQAFDAAGIEAQVPGTVDEVPDDLRELFAWAVREGTTNVLRHAGATRVEITMTEDTLVVDDDGRGPEVQGPGNGLDGLAERARQVGARVEVSTSPCSGYRLLVTRSR